MTQINYQNNSYLLLSTLSKGLNNIGLILQRKFYWYNYPGSDFFTVINRSIPLSAVLTQS